MGSSEPPLSLIGLIRSDLRAMIFDRGRGRVRHIATAIWKVIVYPRIRTVIYYRLSHFCSTRGLGPIAFWFQQMGLKCGGAEIHPAAKIGPFFCLFHSVGVVIGDQVVIGENFKCFQGVTLGDAGSDPGQPVIGNSVTIYAGAKVLGPVSLGDRAIIGANAVVLIDVPADGVAVGVPARVITDR